jgi:SAM-dependent methyltransferase
MQSSHDPAEYGDRIAHLYDELYPGTDSAERAAEMLAGLAGDGTVLELGIGTGRIALPLVRRGVPVCGVDSSQAMVDELRTKPGGEAIPVTIGDFGSAALGGPYSLVFVAFNTFFGLVAQEDQVRGFANVASSLTDGGRFVMEAFVPDLARFDRGQRTSAAHVQPDSVAFEVSEHDVMSQTVRSAHVIVTEAGNQIFPVTIRYAWPSELDLMARLAGFELEGRWSSWSCEPFSSASTGHISVWRKTGSTSPTET